MTIHAEYPTPKKVSMNAIEGGAKDNALVLLDELNVGGQMSYDTYCQLHDAVSAIPEQGTCHFQEVEWQDTSMPGCSYRRHKVVCDECGFELEADTHWKLPDFIKACPSCGAKVVEQ